MDNKLVRIKDIAKLAGVSVGTVDRVLHNRGKVSEKSLQRVHAVLKEIDYRPNLIARSLGLNKTFRIAALLPDPSLDSYWAQSFEGINKGAGDWLQRGLAVDFFYYDLHNQGSFISAARAVSDSTCDGVLVAPLFYKEALPFFQDWRTRNLPFILFNTAIDEAHPLSFIGQDLYQSGRLAAELTRLGMCGTGKAAILHVHEDLPNSVHLMAKEKGFRDYFENAADENAEVISLHLSAPQSPAFANELSALFSDQTLKGVFISTSKAFHVVNVLRQTGRSDIRVTGYDLLEENLALLREGFIHFLINQNPSKQAALGVEHLANHLIFKLTPATEYLLPLEIVSRENMASYQRKGDFS